ncbi:MAG: hypothetical protein SFX18_03205 [Pirellulales bacterium]|nr:hypothetical protein [Pirellulales bacterium]
MTRLDLDSLLEKELDRDERLVWSDQPIPSRYARGVGFIWLFAIPWTAFAVFWTGGALWMGGQMQNDDGFFGLVRFVFPLFGLPFILVGLGMLSAPYWVRQHARQTIYGITDRRAIVLSKNWLMGLKVRSFRPAELKNIERQEFDDGSGTITFYTRAWRDSDGDHRTDSLGFTAIPNVRQVEELLRAMVATHENAASE